MRQHTRITHLGFLLGVWGVLQASASAANRSHCDSWPDAEFAADASQSGEFLQFIAQPVRLDADLDYRDGSPDKPRVDRLYHFDNPDNVRCTKLAVRDGKISLRQAAENYTRALAKFRGCSDREVEKLIASQRKADKEAQKDGSKSATSDQPSEMTPGKVHRLNWAAELYEKSGGRIFAFVSAPGAEKSQFGTAVLRFNKGDDSQRDQRVPIVSDSESPFCESVPAIERRLNALYSEEQTRLNAKKSEDGTAECLAWFAASPEFNGKPNGSGLMSYLKITPVSTSKFTFDPEYSRVSETDGANSKLTQLILTPYQSVDHISLTRDEKGQLVTAEISISGVRKSRFDDEMFFNKTVDFDYSGGRCRPQTIEFNETGAKFKITEATCRQLQAGQSPDSLARIEKDAKSFVEAYRKANRGPATRVKGASGRSATVSTRNVNEASPLELVRNFCSDFDFYLTE